MVCFCLLVPDCLKRTRKTEYKKIVSSTAWLRRLVCVRWEETGVCLDRSDVIRYRHCKDNWQKQQQER